MALSNAAAIVHRALTLAGIPFESVSIGDPANRATWLVTFTAAATPAQQASAATLLTTVVVDAAAQAVQDQRDAQTQMDAIPIVTKAIVLALIDQLNVIRAALPVPLGAITPAQAIAAIRTKAGQL
jgi:hypothetical protein